MAYFRRTTNQGSGLIISGKRGVCEKITVTAYSGAGFGGSGLAAQFYDAGNCDGTPFLDVQMVARDSENFDVRQYLTTGNVYAAFTGSGCAVADLR
jgi:hypothetical protein